MRRVIAIVGILAMSIVCGYAQDKGENRPTMLIVTAHPDDWEFCMGGTAWLLKDKFNIHIAIASKGERGLSREPSNETAAIRVKEAECAAAKINGVLHWLGKIDGEIYADKDGVDKIIDLLNELKPSLIFILWPLDKPDHAAAGNMAHIALTKTGMIYDHEIYFMNAGLGATTTQFDPQIFVNTTAVWDKKRELIRCHACQNKDDGMLKTVEQNDRLYGRLNRTEFAEGFIPVFPFTSGRWDSNKKIKCTLLDL